MMESIFGNAGNSLSGTMQIKTLINQNSVNYLKTFNFPRRFEMIGSESPIYLDDATCKCYSTYNFEEYKPPDSGFWSLVAVYHNDLDFSKAEILEKFYEIVGDYLFIPYAYHHDKFIDYFLVTAQNDALREMIKSNLQIKVREWKLPFIIKTEVSKTMEGQLRPKRNMGTYLLRKYKETGSLGVLDLSNLSSEPEFLDISVSLRNKGVCKMFFDELNSIKHIKGLRILKLCGNELNTLEYFKYLYDFKSLQVLDLSCNHIRVLDELKNIKDLNLKELIILENPICNAPKFEHVIQKLLPTLRQCNSKILFNDEASTYFMTESGNKEISNISDGISINPNNCNSYRNRFDKIYNEKFWSHITLVHYKRFSAQEIMKELSNQLNDVHFYPCYFKRLENKDEFFVYRNSDALKKLLMNGLKIKMSNMSSFTVDVNIRLNVAEFKFSEVNWFRVIKDTVSNRIKNNVLNLDDFPKDPAFSKMIVLMNSCHTMEFILSQAKKLDPSVTKITVQNCNITNCAGFDFLPSFGKLKILDLRNNNIKTLTDISQNSGIQEVYLDGNPICNMNKADYINHVREHFRRISWIDGCKVSDELNIVTYQNFIISSTAHMVTSEFVKHFFTLWDSFERLILMNMYRENSIFTLSIHYDFNEKHSSWTYAEIHPRLHSILKFNRNLEKISNISRSSSNVFIGKDIAPVFGELPRSRHEFSIFTVDVPFFNRHDGKIIIVVGGVFEEFINNYDERCLPFSFSRAFIVEIANGNLTILNDQLSLRGPTTAQVEELKNRKTIATFSDIREKCQDLLANEFEQKAMKIIMLQKLTECSKGFCKKLLAQCSWDIKVALSCFNDKLEKNEIPDDQFKFK